MKECVSMALKLIKEAEGFSGSIYLCPAGYQTIGYGRNIETNPLSNKERLQCFESSDGIRVSKNTAEDWLKDEVLRIVDRVQDESYFKNLDPLRQAVIIDLIYNLGFKKFQSFKKCIQALKDFNFGIASEELKDSRWFNQVGNRGVRNVEIMKIGKI